MREIEVAVALVALWARIEKKTEVRDRVIAQVAVGASLVRVAEEGRS